MLEVLGQEGLLTALNRQVFAVFSVKGKTFTELCLVAECLQDVASAT